MSHSKSRKRHVRKRRGSPHIKQKRRKKLIKKQNELCAICGKLMQTIFSDRPDYATLDHIIPLGAGGKNTKDNMQAAHHSCNQNKGSEIL